VDSYSVRNRTRARVAVVRAWALEMLDVVPGLRRLVNELVRIGVIDRCMVIAAQGLLALVPLLIVLASFLPHDLAVVLVDRFESATGIVRSESEEVYGTLTADQVRAQTGTVGLVLTLLSATSFARSIQRMYERTWEKQHVGGLRGARRCFLWLLGWLMLLQLVGLLGSALGGGAAGTAGRAVVQGVSGSVLWCWTAHVLLVGRVAWRRLLPGAVVTSLAILVYTGGSSVVMPRYVANSAIRVQPSTMSVNAPVG
jgi:membrane protein